MTPKEEKAKIMEQAKERFLHHVGGVIRTYRNRNGIERKELAEALGYDPVTISRFELGEADIKASTMAYASILCDFPMYKYTDVYDREPAAVVDDFKTLVKITLPKKHRKPAKQVDNRPPKPRVVFDEAAEKWVMKEAIVVDVGSLDDYDELRYPLDEADNTFFCDYMSNNSQKMRILTYMAEMVDMETMHGNKKCSVELRNMIKATLKYLTSDKNRQFHNRLSMYAKGITAMMSDSSVSEQDNHL